MPGRKVTQIKNKKGELIYEGNLNLVGGSTQLQGAILEGALLEGANLEGAEYNDETVFPRGFDPVKFKMIKRE